MADTKISSATNTTTLPEATSIPIAITGEALARRITRDTLRSSFINVRDYGATGDGSTDDTVVVQSTLDSIPATGATILFPVGVYRITQTLTLTNKRGVRLVGQSQTGTLLKWRGALGEPLLKLTNLYAASLEHLGLEGWAVNPPSALIQSHHDTAQPSDYGASYLYLNDVGLGAATVGNATYGLRFTCAADSDQGNDMGRFQGVNITNMLEAGVSIEHGESMGHQFRDCFITGGKRGIDCRPVGGNCGSFHWHGGYMSGHTVANFDLSSPANALVIDGLNSEFSARLLDCAGPTGASWPVTLRGIRFDPQSLHADNVAVQFKYPGPLIIEGCLLGSTTKAPLIRLHNDLGEAVVRGNLFGSPNVDPVVNVGAAFSVTFDHNLYINQSGAAVRKEF